MEDILTFLMVIGCIGIGIIKQYRKEADKNAAPVPGLPDTPDTPQSARPAPLSRKAPARPRKAPLHPTPAAPPLSEPQAPEETSEFSIRSAEEARKAIIWSEILNRKY